MSNLGWFSTCIVPIFAFAFIVSTSLKSLKHLCPSSGDLSSLFCHNVGMSVLFPGFLLDVAGIFVFVRHFCLLFHDTFAKFRKVSKRTPGFSWINAVKL